MISVTIGEITVHYDQEYDIAYVRYGDAQIAYSEVLNDYTWKDFDATGKLVGVQLFDAQQHEAFKSLKQIFNTFPKEEEVERVLSRV